MKALPDASVAIIAAVVFFPAPACEDCEDDGLGFQFRHAVQILHGLPSGPMTMPGGNGGFGGVLDSGLALLISVLVKLTNQNQYPGESEGRSARDRFIISL